MKIYLAAQFKEQPLMRQWEVKLKAAGHKVTSRWLYHTEEDLKNNPNEAYNKANIDLCDIDISDCMISHTLNRGDLFTGGGRHIEYGYAMAKGKKLINVGGSESVFHTIAITVPTIEDAIGMLDCQ